MVKKRIRDIGAEALEGIREIKRGEVGRVMTLSPVPKEEIEACERTSGRAERAAGRSAHHATPLISPPISLRDGA